MVTMQEPLQGFSLGARQLVEMAESHQRLAKHPQLGTHHWLLALLERNGPMAVEMTKEPLKGSDLQANLREKLRQGNIGSPLDQATVVQKTVAHAKARGKPTPTERDLAATILECTGYTVVDALAAILSATQAQPEGGAAAPPPYQPKALLSTQTLDKFGRDLTLAALQGKLQPVVGREDEIEQVMITLCRHTKRNPVLIGFAGVGKTAIVEGLAKMIVAGAVPAALQGVRLIEVRPQDLLAGASMAGQFEQRFQAMVAEASQDGIILFIDEIHDIVGAGGMRGTGDAAALIKPYLARESLACIGSTTDNEYRIFIEPDAALARRFQPIAVQELTAEQTLEVLKVLRDKRAQQKGITVADDVLVWMVEFAKDYLRNRHFPDKAVDVLEQCLAEAQKEGQASVSQAKAKLVAQKMVGMPLDAKAQLKRLQAILTEHGLMVEKDVATLIRRLSVTLHNLDMRSVRPNAVVLLLGEATSTSDMLAEAIAEALFESVERVVTIDFSRFSSPHDITMLLGAPPAYVGFGGDLPIYRIAQMPWCVIRCEQIQACHPQVAEVLIKGLANGMLTDATGKNIYLSEAVILLTAELDLKPHHLGLGHAEPTLSDAEVLLAVNKALHPTLLEQVDLICTQLPEAGETRRKWLQQELLTTLADRYRMKGLTLQWDPSLLDWLVSLKQLTRQQDWERFIDDEVSTQLVAYLPEPEAEKGSSLLVAYRDGHLQVEVVSPKSN